MYSGKWEPIKYGGPVSPYDGGRAVSANVASGGDSMLVALTPTGPCVGHRSRKPNMLIADDANVEVAGVDVKWRGVMWCGVVWDIVV